MFVFTIKFCEPSAKKERGQRVNNVLISRPNWRQ